MSRVMRGTAALAALLAGLVGLPAALVVLGGNPLPTTLSWSAISRALLTPDDGSILLALVAVVGWLAWLVFAASVVSEAVALVSRSRVRIQLPGLGGPQRLAAGLLISVLAMLSVPQVAQAPAPTVAPPAVAVAPISQPRPVAPAPPGPVLAAEPADTAILAAPTGARPVTHEVEAGDDLWSLAEHYYGQGRDWRKIAAANPAVLTGGPDRLEPGWRLVIPDLALPGHTSAHHSVVVRRGDTLSSLADRELGSAQRWREIFRLNRAQVDDPDELTVGMHLTLPGANASPVRAVGEAAARQDRAPAQPRGGASEPAPQAAPPAPSSPSERTASATPAPTADGEPAPPTSVADRPAPAPQAAGASTAVDPELAPALAGVGGLLAAGLLGGLALRRRIQLQLRPVGRRIAHPPGPARAAEVALGHRQRPLSLRTLDRAMRAVAAHCRNSGAALPPLQYARVGDDEIELVFSQPWPDPPVGFTARGRSWLLHRADAGYLSSVPGLSDSGRPWPTLVTLGHDDSDRQVVGDLEAMGLLQLRSEQPAGSEAVLAALAVELSFSPWADEMFLTLVGSCDGLPAALGKHNVARTDDLDGLLARLARRAQAQREHQPPAVLGQHRIDPNLADPWAAEIVLINAVMSPGQRARLEALVQAQPRVTIAAVVTDPSISTPWSLQLPAEGGEAPGLLEPAGILLRPQRLDPPDVRSVIQLVETTGSELTTAAPWWTSPVQPPDPPPDNVALLERGAGWGAAEAEGQEAVMRTVVTDPDHPTLQLLGPIELLGEAGNPPPRAGKQCLEYCAWLLENPGTTAQAMATALVVAEGTRRSNMSRLRGWLGADASGEPYLPDAYTGRILLHPAVSSDWHQLKILVGPGVNRVGVDCLRTALGLVRGAPLADAAPGQWHWAEEMRTDMISCLRDIGVELATRALERGDIDLARWAAARALVAAPGDELLMATRIRTEHLAGNAAETERLTLQLAAQARSLGVDLSDETVVLLQQVMEGRVRARMA